MADTVAVGVIAEALGTVVPRGCNQATQLIIGKSLVVGGVFPVRNGKDVARTVQSERMVESPGAQGFQLVVLVKCRVHDRAIAERETTGRSEGFIGHVGDQCTGHRIEVAARVIGVGFRAPGIAHAAQAADTIGASIVGENDIEPVIRVIDEAQAVQCIVAIVDPHAAGIDGGGAIARSVVFEARHTTVAAVQPGQVIQAIVGIGGDISQRVGDRGQVIPVVIAQQRLAQGRIGGPDQAIQGIKSEAVSVEVRILAAGAVAVAVIAVMGGMQVSVDHRLQPVELIVHPAHLPA